jgi:hypothetical protein
MAATPHELSRETMKLSNYRAALSTGPLSCYTSDLRASARMSAGRWAPMRFLLLLLMLALTGCSGPQKSGISPNSSHAAIAKEIVSIHNTFGNALLQLNNTNVAIFVAEAESCSSRLEMISKELDVLGPFPTRLRETTRKAMDDAEKAHARIAQIQMASAPPPLQPEAAKILEQLGDRFFSAWGEVQMKAGLDIDPLDAKAPGTDELRLVR